MEAFLPTEYGRSLDDFQRKAVKIHDIFTMIVSAVCALTFLYVVSEIAAWYHAKYIAGQSKCIKRAGSIIFRINFLAGGNIMPLGAIIVMKHSVSTVANDDMLCHHVS